MRELRVPPLAKHPFRAHYRGLIFRSLLRAAETQAEQNRARGRSFRAWRAERTAERVRALSGGAPAAAVPGARWFGPGLRSALRIAWVVTLALLIGDLAVFGVDSWATSVADVGLIVLTFVWFFVAAVDLGKARTTQLTLFP